MSPFSAPVLGGAALVSAPALWSSLVTGTMPLADGLLRYVVTVAACWVGLSVVAALIGPAPSPAPVVRNGSPGGDTRSREDAANTGEPGGRR